MAYDDCCLVLRWAGKVHGVLASCLLRDVLQSVLQGFLTASHVCLLLRGVTKLLIGNNRCFVSYRSSGVPAESAPLLQWKMK